MVTSITIFLQWIYIYKGTKQRTHNTRAPFIQYFTAWSTFKTPLKIKETH
jgi:hypothetical protein